MPEREPRDRETAENRSTLEMLGASSFQVLNYLGTHASLRARVRRVPSPRKGITSQPSTQGCVRTQRLNQCNVELLLVDGRVALDRHDAAQLRLDLRQHIAFGGAQSLRDFGVDPKDDFVVIFDIAGD